MRLFQKGQSITPVTKYVLDYKKKTYRAMAINVASIA